MVDRPKSSPAMVCDQCQGLLQDLLRSPVIPAPHESSRNPGISLYHQLTTWLKTSMLVFACCMPGASADDASISTQRGYAKGNYHSNMTSLLNAAKEGCRVCERLVQAAVQDAGPLEHCILLEYRFWDQHPDPYFLATMTIERDEQRIEIDQCFGLLRDCIINPAISKRRSNLPLQDAMHTARHWMQDCSENHDECQENASPRTYPTRLLELQGSTLRLILSANERPTGPYAALSYCWGPNPTFLRLSASNFQMLCGGVAYSELPVAFQEAIEVIQQLSIKYLWIDSLCIMQEGSGSSEDWFSESGKMHEVYANCNICLSILRAANPDESFLGGPDPEIPWPFEVDVDRAQEGMGYERIAVVPQEFYLKGFYNLPLYHRGWTLQERLLAPRVLGIGSGQLFWDCVRVPNASESLPKGGHITELLPDNFIPMDHSRTNLQEFWLQKVQEYCDSELTRPAEDKLVAISAIAKIFAVAMGDIYVAGHFLDTLPYSLAWHPEGQTRLERSAHRINIPGGNSDGDHRLRRGTPSWSWASMDGPLSTFFYSNSSIAEMVSYEVVPVNAENPFGQVEFATLTIRARCFEVKWNGSILVGLERVLSVDGLNPFDPLEGDQCVPDQDNSLKDGAAYMLAFVMGTGSQGVSALILESVMDGQTNLYRRVGLVQPQVDHDRIQEAGYSFEGLMDRLFGPQERVPIVLI